MTRPFRIVPLAAVAACVTLSAASAQQSRSELDSLIAAHARANNVPETLVHRVVLRESRYNAKAIGRGGAMGLMQIKHATARGLGYSGTAAGLLDANTNLAYGVKYLAGAYRAAGGNGERAWAYYRSGYYYVAKQQARASRIATRAGRPARVARTPDDVTGSVYTLSGNR